LCPYPCLAIPVLHADRRGIEKEDVSLYVHFVLNELLSYCNFSHLSRYVVLFVREIKCWSSGLAIATKTAMLRVSRIQTLRIKRTRKKEEERRRREARQHQVAAAAVVGG
jgi:hypothetical protein